MGLSDSGRLRGLVDGLKLDWGGFAEASLAALSVVRLLDPGHDCQPELFVVLQMMNSILSPVVEHCLEMS